MHQCRQPVGSDQLRCSIRQVHRPQFAVRAEPGHHPQDNAFLSSALDKVMAQITRILQDHEQKQRKLQASGGSSDPQSMAAGKTIRFTAGCSKDRQVKVPRKHHVAGRGLREYLALPLDQYSLLDPQWITRQEDAPDLFVLKVPLHDMMHVMLEPSVTIKVDVDTERSRVKFHAFEFKLGDPRFDGGFTLDMDATLSCKAPSTGLLSAMGWPSRAHPTAAAAAATALTPSAAAQQQSSSSSSFDGLQPADAPSHTNSTQSSSGQCIPTPDSAGLQSNGAPETRQHVPVAEQLDEVGCTGAAAVASGSTATGQAGSSNSSGLQGTAASLMTHTHGNGDEAALGGNSLQVAHLQECQARDQAQQQQHKQQQQQQEQQQPSHAENDVDAVEEVPAGVLKGKVHMTCSVHIPSPLSVVPGPLLGLAGSLVARFALNSLLPAFLQLLAVDFGRWASGSRLRGQAAGSLLAASGVATSPHPVSSTSSSASSHGEHDGASSQDAQPSLTRAGAATSLLLEQALPQPPASLDPGAATLVSTCQSSGVDGASDSAAPATGTTAGAGSPATRQTTTAVL